MGDFANFGNRGICAISFTWKTWQVRDFTWSETGTLAGQRFRFFMKTRLVRDFSNSEIAADSRFHLAGKRNRLAGNDCAYLENVADARFR